MDIKTKAFLRELSHLLCRYDAEITTAAWYDGDIVVNVLSGEEEIYSTNDGITWQEIDLALEEDQ
jgi:hypothetical protein